MCDLSNGVVSNDLDFQGHGTVLSKVNTSKTMYFRNIVGYYRKSQAGYRMLEVSMTLVTSDQDFKGAVFFEIKHAINGAR